jgi:RecJ-like exonuclease
MVEGVLSRVRYDRRGCSCTLTDGKVDYRFSTEETVAQGAAVLVEGEIEGSDIRPSMVVMLDGEKAGKVYADVKARLKESMEMPDGPSLLKDEVVQRLWPAMKETALELRCAKRLGRSVLLRFHGDADGISGAFALSDVIRCKAFQQNAAIYSARDALRDISTAGQEGRPLVILLDFASNDESQEAVGLLEAAGIEVMIIDHHPPGSRRGILNPFLAEGGGSEYTAGYLACEVAAACGLDEGRAGELARIACAGDKSDVMGSGPEDAGKAMVLDFLAAHISFGNNLDFYRKVMANEGLFTSIRQQAKESIDEAADKAMQGMKESGIVFSFPLDRVVTKGEWPPAGKITTCIFERLARDGPLVCIGHTEHSLIIRLNDAAAGKGLSANSLARGIVQDMPDFTVGGGGHARAGAIRVRKGFSKDVLGELVRRISCV